MTILTLVLAGIATSRVVLSTLRYAADADYALFVAHDCCSDSDPDVHEMLIKKVFVRSGTVASSVAIACSLQPVAARASTA